MTLIKGLAGTRSNLESEVLSVLTDPYYQEKHVYNQRPLSTRKEASIQAHCLSVCIVEKAEDVELGNQFQSLTSTLILMKSLYSNLYQFVTALGKTSQFRDNLRQTVIDVSRELLKVKLECPFLELNDSGNTFDFEMNDNLLERVFEGTTVANKDFLKYREFEVAVTLLSEISSLDSEAYRAICPIAAELVGTGLFG